MSLVSPIAPHVAPRGVRRPVLVIVEGSNDIAFLTRLSARIHFECPDIPELQRLVADGAIVFVPFGGGNPGTWATRLAPLGLPEFHLYDREMPPETEWRLRAADVVRNRPGCRAAITGKRSLENYLHPEAIAAAGGGEVAFDDEDDVAAIIARTWYEGEPGQCPWADIPRRRRARRIDRAKRWLNTIAVEHMTAALLSESDPRGDVLCWLDAIATMAGDQEEAIHHYVPSTMLASDN